MFAFAESELDLAHEQIVASILGYAEKLKASLEFHFSEHKSFNFYLCSFDIAALRAAELVSVTTSRRLAP